MLVTLFLVIGMSCKNDPYPTDAIFEPVGKKVEKSQSPLLFLHIPTIMRFSEGEEKIYEIAGITPSGESLIEVQNLPEGAIFDSDTSELRWTPGFDAAGSFYDESGYREYTVSFQLYDAENTLHFVEKEVSLIVFDNPQEIMIETSEQSELYEEKEHTQKIEFSYKDGSRAFIKDIYSDNLPAGAKFREVKTGKEYRLTFKPEAHFVSPYGIKSTTNTYYRDVNFEIQAVESNGRITTKVINWRIYDKKKPIEIFAPRIIQGSNEVFFTVILVDRNGEKSPTLDIDSGLLRVYQPLIKKTVFSRYGDVGEKWSYYSVHWKNIPSNNLGKIYELKLKSCAHRLRDCRKFSIDIDFRNSTTKRPGSIWNNHEFMEWNQQIYGTESGEVESEIQ